jgi:hypothetical protein
MAGSQSSERGTRDVLNVDVEQKAVDSSLKNDTIRNFGWQGLTVTIKDRKTKEPKAILANVDGYVESGKS